MQKVDPKKICSEAQPPPSRPYRESRSANYSVSGSGLQGEQRQERRGSKNEEMKIYKEVVIRKK